MTLHEPGAALTGNYLKAELAQRREANRLVDLRIGGVSGDGLREQSALALVPSGSC